MFPDVEIGPDDVILEGSIEELSLELASSSAHSKISPDINVDPDVIILDEITEDPSSDLANSHPNEEIFADVEIKSGDTVLDDTVNISSEGRSPAKKRTKISFFQNSSVLNNLSWL